MLIGFGETQMAVYRNRPLLCFVLSNFYVAFPDLVWASLSAQTLEIHLVVGVTTPYVGASSYVNVWVGTERKEAIAIPTDGNGVARLQLTLIPVKQTFQTLEGSRIYRCGPSCLELQRVPPNQHSLRIVWIRRIKLLVVEVEKLLDEGILQHGYVSQTHVVKPQFRRSPDK